MAIENDYLKGLQFAQHAIQNELEKLYRVGYALRAVGEEKPKRITAKESVLNDVLSVIATEYRKHKDSQELLEKARENTLKVLLERSE